MLDKTHVKHKVSPPGGGKDKERIRAHLRCERNKQKTYFWNRYSIPGLLKY